MLLYHGTSEEIARKCLKYGIRPRRLTGSEGNWKHSVDSSMKTVYLSSAYAPYFAATATKENKRIAIIEVDVSMLDESLFRPDEDFIEQVLRKEFLFHGIESMKHRTQHVRDWIDHYKHLWPDSLEHMGNLSYKGSVPKKSFNRVTVFDPCTNPYMWLQMMDPTITVLNYKLCGDKYKALTRWVMGGEIEVGDLFGGFHPQIQPWKGQKRAYQQCQEMLEKGKRELLYQRKRDENHS